jgi:sigma-B regulation protein RsbQ
MTIDVHRRNAVTVAGPDSAPTMLFAHGFATDQSLWHFVEPAFRERYRTVTFDYAGSGRSDRQAYDPVRYASIEGFADDVLEICEALDLRDVIFVGHSFSSMVGAVAAIRAPARFAHLIMIGPNACFENDPPYIGGFERADLLDLLALMERNVVGWANFMAPVAMKNEERPELTEAFAQTLASNDPEVLCRSARVVFLGDQRAYLPRCAVPTLLLQCVDDSIAPASAVEYLHAHLPNSTLHPMHATGHCPHVSHPAETIAVIENYLAAASG